MSPTPPDIALDRDAVVRRLREVDGRSGGRRVAWSDAWRSERSRFDALVRELVPGIQISADAFANRWYVLPGTSPDIVLLGSHTDCVPEGGWLDGILGVHAGLAVLAAIARDQPERRRTVALVDWADEEGVRFGRSLLGSSAACGGLSEAEFARLADPDGTPAADVVARDGFQPERLGTRAPVLDEVIAALELHIEQGPVLEASGRRVAAVTGCLGVDRGRYMIRGRSGHAGATPMDLRADPVRAASEAIAALTEAVERGGGLATVGQILTRPGIATAVAAECAFTLDLRHHEAAHLAELSAAAHTEICRHAMRRGCAVDHSRLFSIAPVDFDPRLVEAATRLTGGGPALRSGPLHDSAALAVAGVPTVMMFAPSTGGISHTRAEDTPKEALSEAIERFGALAFDLIVS